MGQLPTFLHASSHYKACSEGDYTEYNMQNCQRSGSDLWTFHKGHVPVDILECDHPLLMLPPDDLFNVQKREYNTRAARNAFAICNSIHMINRAALEYKQ